MPQCLYNPNSPPAQTHTLVLVHYDVPFDKTITLSSMGLLPLPMADGAGTPLMNSYSIFDFFLRALVITYPAQKT